MSVPIAPYIDHMRREGMPFDLYAYGPDTVTWATGLYPRLVWIKVKGLNVDNLLKDMFFILHSKEDRIKLVLGQSIASADRITPGRWLPYSGAEYHKGWGKVWYMATFEDGPVTITLEGIRTKSQIELEDAFQNTKALVGISKKVKY